MDTNTNHNGDAIRNMEFEYEKLSTNFHASIVAGESFSHVKKIYNDMKLLRFILDSLSHFENAKPIAS